MDMKDKRKEWVSGRNKVCFARKTHMFGTSTKIRNETRNLYLFGVKQSGDLNFKIADLRKDFKILLQAKKDSQEFLGSGNLDNYEDIKKEMYRSLNLVDV